MKLRLLSFILLLSTQLSADISLPTQRETREEQDTESAHLQELVLAYMDLGLHERAQETLNRFHALIERLPRESAAPLLEKESNLRRQLGRQQYRFSELAEHSIERVNYNYGPNPPSAKDLSMEKARRSTGLARCFVQLGQFDAALAALDDATATLNQLPQDYTGRKEHLDCIVRLQQLLNEIRAEYYADNNSHKLSRHLKQRLNSIEDEMEKFCRGSVAFNEALSMALRFAPQVDEWSQLQLRRDLILLHGIVERASGFGIDAPAMLLYAVQHTDDGLRCVLCAADPLTWLRGAQFRLEGNEIHATLPDGQLLARYALWHKAPARFAPAPQVLPLRYLGADKDSIHVEITNLTAYPIELAEGSISAAARLADGSVYLCGTAYTAAPFLPLQPGEKKELHLKFHYSVESDFNQLKEAQSVQLCYNAHKPRRSPYLSPLQIPYAGTPMMYRGGSFSWGIPIDDETFISVISCGYGYITDTYHIYRKEDGLWKHIGQFTCYPTPAPGSDTTQTTGCIYGHPVGIRREGNNLHLLNAQGNIFASIELSE